jgi:hypothetical protein
MPDLMARTSIDSLASAQDMTYTHYAPIVSYQHNEPVDESISCCVAKRDDCWQE